MPKQPRGKPPSQRSGYRPSGGGRFRPLNFSAIELDVAYEKTATARHPEPVVFVINLDDEIGGNLGREVCGSDQVAEIKSDFRQRPEAPRMTFAVESAEDALVILSSHFEDATLLEAPIPPGHYRVVVIDRGGVTCHPCPVPG